MAQKQASKDKGGSSGGGFTEAEKAAMQERARELKADTARGKGSKADKRASGEADILAKIAEMPKADRVMAERIHAIVTANAPGLMPRTWYGMPAYTNAEGKNVVFFQAADKFKARYATLGFDEGANLDEGSMWPTSYALTRLTKADEERVVKLVKQAVS